MRREGRSRSSARPVSFGGSRWLVPRLRLFRRWIVLARRSLSGRAGSFCLGAAARRTRLASSPCNFSSNRLRAFAGPLEPRPRANPRACVRPRARGIGSRLPLHGVPLERFRHGSRPVRAARARGLDRRLARADAAGHCHRRFSGDIDRRHKLAAALCTARDRLLRASGCRLVRRLATERGDGERGTECPVAHHAAQCSAGLQIPAWRRRRDSPALPRSIRSVDIAERRWPRQCHAPHLAGICLSLCAEPRATSARHDRRRARQPHYFVDGRHSDEFGEPERRAGL